MKPMKSPMAILGLVVLLLAGACFDERQLSPAPLQPAPRSGSALPTITFGPVHLGVWGTFVRVEWEADPAALHYEYAFTSFYDFAADTGDTTPNSVSVLIAWMDSATVIPGTAEPMWNETSGTLVEFPDAVDTAHDPNKLIFGVRSIYDGDRAPLAVAQNLIVFDVDSSLAGPRVTISSNYGECRNLFSAQTPTAMISPDLRFEWETSPGPTQLPAVMTEWSIDDGPWMPSTLGPDHGAYPESETEFWHPEPGPHQLLVRATDPMGLQDTTSFPIEVVAAEGRGILVVRDTNASSLVPFVPPFFDIVEEAAVRAWLGGHYSYDIHATHGFTPPTPEQLAAASTVIWLVTAGDQDPTVLGDAMIGYPFSSLLESWRRSGGNLILCGTQPSGALRYFRHSCSSVDWASFPIRFDQTESPDYVRHFALDGLGLKEIGGTVLNAFNGEWPPLAAAAAERPHFPDLHFDPLKWPNGTATGGFGCYDGDLVPYGSADVLYTLNETERPIALADFRGRGRRGSSVFLAFHPYYMNAAEAGALFDVVLSRVGEIRRGEQPSE
ncbi:hypothetical protein K8I85_05260 [bacterium]|nr:hypothetical protein [bacterium]